MSSTSAPPLAVVLAPSAPPLGLNHIAALDSSITFLLIGTACSAMLVPIAVILFFFSTSSGRRQPGFILNMLMIALGLAEGVINIFNQVRSCGFPGSRLQSDLPNFPCQTRSMHALPVPVGLCVAFACSTVLIPIVADTVLLLRVFTVYPPSHMQLACIAGVYGGIACIKVPRTVVETVFVVEWARKISVEGASLSLLVAGQAAWRTPFLKASLFLQLADSKPGCAKTVISPVEVRFCRIPPRLRGSLSSIESRLIMESYRPWLA